MGRLSRRSAAMKLAWEKRKKRAAMNDLTTKDLVQSYTVRKPIGLSSQRYSIDQVRDLGFAAITDDGQSYQFIKVDGKFVAPADLI